MTEAPAASPFWQNAFLILTGVILAYSAWRGWRKGVARSAMGLFGILAGYLVGFAAAPRGVALMGGLVPLPDVLIGALFGFVAGLLTYIVVALAGGALFKRTDQQNSPLLRFSFGAGGALIGLVFGLALLWGVIVFVRGYGALVAGQVAGRAVAPVAAIADLPRSPGRAAPAQPAQGAPPAPPALVAEFAEIRRSIESGVTGEFVKSLDLMPEQTYRILEKTGRVLSSREAMERLLEFPSIQDVTGHPKFVALTTDPELNQLARTKNVTAMVSHPKVTAAANDPDLIERLKKIDMEKALDHALRVPQPAVEPE
jgi:uncharacterized membrane protein YjfL (UPF0719 family)